LNLTLDTSLNVSYNIFSKNNSMRNERDTSIRRLGRFGTVLAAASIAGAVGSCASEQPDKTPIPSPSPIILVVNIPSHLSEIPSPAPSAGVQKTYESDINFAFNAVNFSSGGGKNAILAEGFLPPDYVDLSKTRNAANNLGWQTTPWITGEAGINIFKPDNQKLLRPNAKGILDTVVPKGGFIVISSPQIVISQGDLNKSGLKIEVPPVEDNNNTIILRGNPDEETTIRLSGYAQGAMVDTFAIDNLPKGTTPFLDEGKLMQAITSTDKNSKATVLLFDLTKRYGTSLQVTGNGIRISQTTLNDK
jgi:hypothetical protein